MKVSIVRQVYQWIIRNVPRSVSLHIQFFRSHQRLLNIQNPKLFSEFIQHRKVYDHDPIYPVLVDKIEVKKYIESLLGSSWVTPTIWSGSTLDIEILKRLEFPYVIKASHSSGQNIFITRDKNPNWIELEAATKSWMDHPYSPHLYEWPYNKVQPQILVEPFLGNGIDTPEDYKLYIFGGRVEMIQVDYGRHTRHSRAFYSPEWLPLSISTKGYKQERKLHEPPRNLDAIPKAGSVIARSIPFVRVDFYDLETGPKFGEITLFPGSGFEPFRPFSSEVELGHLWQKAISNK